MESKGKCIALLTDFGIQDNYVGIMKAVMLRINPNLHFVDICHTIQPHNIFQGAFSLKTSYSYFPKGTIFVVVVDPQVGGKQKQIIIKTKDYVFVGPDNGVLSLMVRDEDVAEFHEITEKKYMLDNVSQTFHGRDIYAPVAAHVSKGVAVAKFGKLMEGVEAVDWKDPMVDQRKQCVIGQIVDIDVFGNLITNLKESHVKEKCVIKLKKTVVEGISNTFSDVEKDKPVALLGSKGLIEICVNGGSAEEILKIKRGDTIKVELRARTTKKKTTVKKVEPEKSGTISPLDIYLDDDD